MSEESDITPETTAAAEASETTEALTEDLSADAQEQTPVAEAADATATDETPEAPAEPEAADEPKAEEADEAPEADAAPETEAAEAAAEADVDEAPEAEAAEEPKAKRAAKPKAEKADKPAKAEPKAKKAEKSKPEVAPEVRAQAKYVRSSARKARLVCDNIRGKSVEEARAILAHTPRAVAEDWSKLLESAVANAEHNHELDGDDLVIKTVKADEGPTIKRFRPRAQGRATPIRKRTAHLTILLTTKD
jgi:ribosomal protein L22